MAGTSTARVPRSGGKMVRPRVAASPRTPYDRPSARALPPNSSFQQNPNWLSRLVISPTRMIASGAGKVISSVFRPDSSSSSSSSSSSDGGDFTSEEDLDDVNDVKVVSSEGAALKEKKPVSEMNNTMRKEPKSGKWKSEAKRVIEQLLLKETFSREECGRLINIIKSRVVDSSVSGGPEDGRSGGIPDGTVGSGVGVPDRSTAVMEAKKWLEEKKLVSDPKSDLEHGTCNLNTPTLPHVAEGEEGSPVDVAKLYMRSRPPWASPTLNYTNYKYPSPTGTELSKEGTPYKFGADSGSSSKLNRDSSLSGSWSIHEEIRKVRSKATEEMLRTQPLMKMGWSSLASDYKRSPRTLVTGILDAAMENKIDSLTKLVDQPSNLGDGINPNITLVPQAEDRSQNEVCLPNTVTSFPGQCQDLGATTIVEEQGDLSNDKRLQSSEDVKGVSQSSAATGEGAKDIDWSNQHFSSWVAVTIQDEMADTRLQEVNSTSKEGSEMDGVVAPNGFFPSTQSSMSAGPEIEENCRPAYEEHILIGSGQNERTKTAPSEETSKLSSVPLIEVPIINENDSLATGSQNSSSTHQEGSSQDPTRANGKRKVAGRTTTGVPEAQQGRKLSRYNRRGRGRGK